MVEVASRLAFALEVPFVVRDFDVCDVRWVEWNVAAAGDPCYKRAPDDNNVAHDAAIAERDIDNLECHAGLRLP
jgi:hypothetical protein